MTTSIYNQNTGHLITSLMNVNEHKNGWKVFLTEYVEYFNIRAANLMVLEKATFIPKFHEEGGVITSDADAKDYIDNYLYRDPMIAKMMSNPGDKFWFLHDLCTVEEFWQTPLYLEWDIKQDIRDGAAVNIFEEQGNVCILLITRSHSQPLFEREKDAQIFDFFTPIIRNAIFNSIELQKNVNDQVRSKSMVELFRMPVAVYTEFGDLWAVNKSMTHLIESNQQLQLIDNTLNLIDTDKNNEFRRGVFDVLHGYEDTIKVTQYGELTLVCISLETENTESTFQGVMVYVLNQTLNQVMNPKLLQDLFLLTPKESDTCLELLKGLVPKQIAAQREVAESTVRENIKNIYKKTQCKNQISLINLLSSIPVV
ncbi:helix-turn-helix transcriptional regulator [Marinicellulosiphila megalodicopiae]|uniref:helix-turn-helix transcriptional regulator n=1 Tax=Marinicellulosiphila megalodicopiae TaxID=2724896 RepID=UPI003BB0EB39